MDKKGISYLAGILTLIVGLVIAMVDIYGSCVKKGTDTLYDTSFTCINQPSFWIILGVGAIIAVIGAYMCRRAN